MIQLWLDFYVESVFNNPNPGEFLYDISYILALVSTCGTLAFIFGLIRRMISGYSKSMMLR